MELNTNLYELNRSAIDSMGAMSFGELDSKRTLVNKFIKDTKNKYYMLYGKEISYFTIFSINEADFEYEDFYLGLRDCFNNIGPVYSLELTKEKDAVEIWIKDENLVLSCFYLFPYDNGVVKIK